MLAFLEKTVLVSGHYGTGKTNLSLNLALALRKEGEQVALADLDIVNPYFRTADFERLAEAHGVELITPAYAGTSLDIPSLTGALDARIGGKGTVIIDVGGDDAGAYAVGRYAPRIGEGGYTMLYVANFFRYLTRTPREAAEVMSEIEEASRLRITHIVNNSNLAEATTKEELLESVRLAEELSEMTGRPLAFTSVRRALADELAGFGGRVFPVDVYVRAFLTTEEEEI